MGERDVPAWRPMELIVLGNSVSAGTGLRDASRAWPSLLARELEQTRGETVSVRHVVFAPTGAGAPAYALKRTATAGEAVVIVSLGSYVCAVATVSERIRKRWGERAARRWLALERAFEGGTGNRGTALGTLNRAGRWLARHTIGVDTITTVDEVVDVYSRVLDGLAQAEHTDVIVFPEPFWPARMDRANPGANVAFGRIRHEVQRVAIRHHFRWADAEPAWSQVPDREVHYQPDGMHKTEEGHRLLAEAVLAQLTTRAEA
jgi:lysophospholipase L1-like esterase